MAGIAIYYQQHLVRSAGFSFLHHPFDFFQLFHQVQLRRQAPCGVDKHHVFATRLACADGIKGHGCRVAAFFADDFDRVAVRPHGQLFACGGSKGIRSGQQHRCAFAGQVFGQFADGRGFTCAVHARHHDDSGLLLANHQRLLQRF